MKLFKNISFMFLTIMLNIIFSMSVFADNKYSISISGASEVANGSNITFTLTALEVANITNGFDGYQGTIEYDSNMLKFVSASGSINGWEFKTNTNQTNKIVFLGYDKDSPDNKKTANTEMFKITFQGKTEGSTQLVFNNVKGTTAVGNSITASPITKSITITAPAPQKSSDANLSNLSVSGYTLSPSFKAGTTSYSLTVGNDVTSLDVSAIANDSKARVSISGNKNLSVGKNNILVEVTAENGNKKTYKIEVVRQAASSPKTDETPKETPKESPKSDTKVVNSKSSNNNLAAINGIDGLEFESTKINYSVEVPFEVTSLNISAIPESKKAKVNISNGSLSNLKVGETRTVTITVTAEDSSIKIYTLKVTRSKYKSETGLKELKVNNEDLIKGEKNKDSYSITVPGDTKKIDVSAIPVSSDATVRIKGDRNLKDGNNTVIVEVTDKNGFTKSYTVNVKRNSNPILNFILKYWFIILISLLILLLILLMLMNLYKKNAELLKEIEEEEKDLKNSRNQTDSPIDNNKIIIYNNYDDNKASKAYVPKHTDDDKIDDILNDNSVSEVTKEIQYVKSDDGDLEKEYKIIENYRKK